MTSPTRLFVVGLAVLLAGCDAFDNTPPPPTPAQVRAQLGRLLPATLADRDGWAADIQTAFTALELPPTVPNLCAALAVIEQESGYKADPPVPGLGRIAREEIERRAQRHGIPRLAVTALLSLDAPDGREYGDKLAAVRTERELSDLFQEIVQRAPAFSRGMLQRANPVRTGGPMQVSIDWSDAFSRARPYPYAMTGSIRQEVFSRRGGVYFGIAHLLKYPNSYPRHLYRFADFNAGHYASRNAAFQAAVAIASRQTLARDGDLVLPGDGISATERAVQLLGPRLGMTDEAIARDLRKGRTHGFENTALYTGVFAVAEQHAGKPLPRALLPQITLASPKISRTLTTQWFAERVEARYRACEARAAR